MRKAALAAGSVQEVDETAAYGRTSASKGEASRPVHKGIATCPRRSRIVVSLKVVTTIMRQIAGTGRDEVLGRPQAPG
jgi:hypothetical protein